MTDKNKTATTGNSDGKMVDSLKDLLEKINKTNQLLQGGLLARLPQEKRIELLEFRVLELEQLLVAIITQLMIKSQKEELM